MPRPFEQLPFRTLSSRAYRTHPYMDLAPRQVVVASRQFGDVTVHYREAGEGEPLVLVHGLMTTSYSWRYLMPLLAEHYRVIAFDLVGCGRSDKPDVAYPPRAVASFVGDVMRTLGVRGCDVVGNSMGGYLCMQLALDDPAAMRRLVNIHSPGVPMARLYALRAAMSLPFSEGLLHKLIGLDPHRWVHKNVHYYDESLKSLEEAREYGEPLRGREGSRAFARYLRDTLDPGAMKRFGARLQRAAFPIPLLYLYAKRDPMVPPWVGESLAELTPSAELSWVDEVSHFMHVDRPERVAPLVLEFLGRGTS